MIWAQNGPFSSWLDRWTDQGPVVMEDGLEMDGCGRVEEVGDGSGYGYLQEETNGDGK